MTVWVNESNSVGLGQLYSFDAIPFGDPFVIGSGSLVRPNIGVVVIPNNRLVTVWDSPPGIKGQIFNEFGNVSSAVFDITDIGVDPRISFLDNGGFAVVYKRGNFLPNNIFMNIFDNNASSINSDILVKGSINIDVKNIGYDISTIQNDRFAVVYVNIPDIDSILFTKIYNNAGGVVVPEFIIDQRLSISNPYITFLSNNNLFIVSWIRENSTVFQIFNNQAQNISTINFAFQTEGPPPIDNKRQTLLATTRLSNYDYVIVSGKIDTEGIDIAEFLGQRSDVNVNFQGNQFIIREALNVTIPQRSSIDTLIENCFVTTWYETPNFIDPGSYIGAKYCANNTAEFCQNCNNFICSRDKTCCFDEDKEQSICLNDFTCGNLTFDAGQGFIECPPTSAPTPSPSQAPTKNQTLNPTNHPTFSPIPNPTSPQIFSTQALQEIKDEGLEALDIIGIIALISGSLFCCCIFLLVARFFYMKRKIQGNRYAHIPRNL